MTTAAAAAMPAQGPRIGAAARVLIVEDDHAMADSMARILASHGHDAACAHSGGAALEKLRAADFDAVVLDIGLPDIDGFEVLNRLGGARSYGVLIVSAFDRVEQRVRGLNLGADDYLVKPFAAEEFEARVRALLRRTRSRRDERIEIADLAVDVGGKRAWVGQNALELTAREWTVLLALLERVGQVVGKDQLQEALARERALTENAIEVYVSRLRNRLTGSGVTIRTLRGFGYMIEEPRAAKQR